MMHGPDLAGRGIVSIYGKMKASVVLSGKVVNNLQILGDLLPVRGLSDERAGRWPPSIRPATLIVDARVEPE